MVWLIKARLYASVPNADPPPAIAPNGPSVAVAAIVAPIGIADSTTPSAACLANLPILVAMPSGAATVSGPKVAISGL